MNFDKFEDRYVYFKKVCDKPYPLYHMLMDNGLLLSLLIQQTGTSVLELVIKNRNGENVTDVFSCGEDTIRFSSVAEFEKFLERFVRII